jgi:uncharacterized protein YicC (UPF0701 family)
MAATKTARKPATKDGHTPAEYLQGALDELNKARERAGGDIRSGIDSAIDRTRDAMKEASSDAQTQVSDWRGSLDKANDELRRELGILAVRAQRSPEALRAMSAEIRKRKTEIAPSK